MKFTQNTQNIPYPITFPLVQDIKCCCRFGSYRLHNRNAFWGLQLFSMHSFEVMEINWFAFCVTLREAISKAGEWLLLSTNGCSGFCRINQSSSVARVEENLYCLNRDYFLTEFMNRYVPVCLHGININVKQNGKLFLNLKIGSPK